MYLKVQNGKNSTEDKASMPLRTALQGKHNSDKYMHTSCVEKMIEGIKLEESPELEGIIMSSRVKNTILMVSLHPVSFECSYPKRSEIAN